MEWHSGFRVVNGKTVEVIEGLISKEEYDWLTFVAESIERENNELRKRLSHD